MRGSISMSMALVCHRAGDFCRCVCVGGGGQGFMRGSVSMSIAFVLAVVLVARAETCLLWVVPVPIHITIHPSVSILMMDDRHPCLSPLY